VSDKNDEFLSFEKALRELKMRSEELKKLVSEGEIRAYRDGDSMKFRKEDVASLGVKSEGQESLQMEDALEDDTGMVTEQISEEDTLLAEDDVVEEKPAARSRPSRAAVAAAPAEPGKEPTWVTVAAFVGFLVFVWGGLLHYSISKEGDPKDSFLTSLFAETTKK
jgi:excisionase family DNA binding protein